MESSRLLVVVALLSIGASVVHGGLTSDHFEEWWGYGVFFALASLAQGFYGFIILAKRLMDEVWLFQTWSPGVRRGFYLAGILGNIALVAMYVTSRTIGVPLVGPEAGEVEAWDALGVFTKGLEVLVLVLLVVLYRSVPPSGRERSAKAPT